MTATETIKSIRGICGSKLDDEQKLKSIKSALTKAGPAKRGRYKMLRLTEDFAAYLRKYRADRIEAGTCTCCGGHNKDRLGKALCITCLTTAKETARARKITHGLQ